MRPKIVGFATMKRLSEMERQRGVLRMYGIEEAKYPDEDISSLYMQMLLHQIADNLGVDLDAPVRNGTTIGKVLPPGAEGGAP